MLCSEFIPPVPLRCAYSFCDCLAGVQSCGHPDFKFIDVYGSNEVMRVSQNTQKSNCSWGVQRKMSYQCITPKLHCINLLFNAKTWCQDYDACLNFPPILHSSIYCPPMSFNERNFLISLCLEQTKKPGDEHTS